MPAQIINFQAGAAALGRFRGVSTRPAPLEHFDTLPCMYCDKPTPPSEVQADWSVIYRCKCKKTFRVIEDGTACRGMRGRPF